MRVLITGAAGLLGSDVCTAVAAAGHEPLGLAHGDLEITDAASVLATVGRARPEVVVNCAAYTNVDAAEGEPILASAVNGEGAGSVARAAAAVGAWVIHISSDYVFDGEQRRPYVESDSVNPLSAYGRSKLEGEHAVADAAPGSHTIVRASWLFGTRGPCFPATILRLAEERDELTVVDDQIGSPTFTGHLAAWLADLVERRPSGVVHAAGAGHCSWYQLATELVLAVGSRCEVKPGSTAELGRPAPRPAYSVLGTERGPQAPRLPHWREGLAQYLGSTVSSS